MTVTQKEKQKIVIKPEKCTGCRVCQMECSWLYHKEFNPSKANIQVINIPERGVTYQIFQTDDCIKCGTCAKACVFGALEIEGGKA